ncbi:zinc finger and BTB domain-containing protein 16-A [Entelurus aequoreus]|uniref:zinc finger and BTB domain-containing protein 16-A n=1 Tax=Entelurus aequoreus TaxID=161455 RepID=UPI002B1DDD8A|nr:zinc finger and BTB domain-containing protein 16-A [Entelurus aequoreus]
MIRLNNTQFFHFLHRADALRRSGSLCDAVITVNHHTFRAHRLVLACASTRLARKLDQEETDHQVQCTLEDISPRTFQQVLDFVYMQTLEVSVDDLRRLLAAARTLEMWPLEEECQHHLDALLRETEEEGQRLQKGRGSHDEADVKKKRREEDKLQDERKKSATTLSRDSVITSSVSHMMPSSSWTFPSHMWSSVSTLRRIAENYSNFIAAQPSAAHAITLPDHVIHMQDPRYTNAAAAHCSAVASLHARYTQHHYTASAGMASSTKQELHAGKKARLKADKNIELSYPNVLRVDTVKACTHRRDAVQPESASSPAGESCARCRLFGKDPQSNAQDHRGERQYQCQHCPKKFSLKHQLDTHHRVHTGEKPFECRLCGQRSRDFSAMIKHLRTHGGASPYQCTLCLEFCSSLVAMQRHVRSHPLHDFPQDWSISSTYLYTSHASQHSRNNAGEC